MNTLTTMRPQARLSSAPRARASARASAKKLALSRPVIVFGPAAAAGRPRPCVLARHGDGDDDGPLPLLRLPRHSEDPIDLSHIKRTPNLGGKTIGEELSLILQAQTTTERHARQRMEEKLYTASRGGAWEGDVYVGRPGEKKDILQVLAAIAFVTPLVGLAFAMATWGTLWGNYTG
jgi:hypothetical protein